MASASPASVVIATYNRRVVLEMTLGALLQQRTISAPYEIVVVDDYSQDDTAAYMRHLVSQTDGIVYLRHGANRGRVRTRNDGIQAARGEIVIFLDDDNVPQADFVAAHVECHERFGDKHIAVMGSVCYAQHIVESGNFARYVNAQYVGNRPAPRAAAIDYNDLPARCFGTLNCSARKADLVEAGMFHPALRCYGGEDVFLGHCLKERGVNIVFAAAARTIHHDAVELHRFKLKCRESTREGLKTIQELDPLFVEGTRVRFLTLPQWQSDSPSRLLSKIGLRVALNDPLLFALEKWAQMSDRWRMTYCPTLFRILMAGWYLQGIRSRRTGQSCIPYGTPNMK
jgi:glycosyltransferase involved in cell wall biosynthesis